MFVRTEAEVSAVGDVHYIEGIVAWRKVILNVYCFVTDGILIDTGSPRLLDHFKPFFAEHPLEQVVITHSHEDHVGGAAYIQSEYNKPILISEKGVGPCTSKADYPLYRKYFWGKRDPFQPEPIGTTFESQHAIWDVIETPGHAEDHLAFLNRETGQLFSGDLFVHPQTKIMLKDESLPTIIQSIQKVLTYDFQEVFCSHAGYLKRGKQMLEKKLSYLLELQDEIIILHQKGFSEKEIQKQIFGKRYPIYYISQGEWDSIHLIRSVLREAENQ